MPKRNHGSVLLTTLVMTFVISTLMLAMTLMVNRQVRTNRVIASQQTSLAEMERFAEETYATFSPLMNHDGTLNDTHLPDTGAGLITSTINPVNCSRQYAADPTNIEVGFITVVMQEECNNAPFRRDEITYQLSPDTTNVISLLPAEPTQPLRLTSFTRLSSTPPSFRASISSTQSGYIRVYVESLNPNTLQGSFLQVANTSISAGTPVTFNFMDPLPVTDTGTRRLKVLYSQEPFPNNPRGRIRRTCPTEGTCGAESLLRINYGLTGTWSAVTPPALP